ncbi:hypothetical protein [Bacillus bingmayongensis]|uniref:hypothetical protein n=1 Tax=Bacillus bingmayongensis TaxID=1150157 RepID=UPI0002FECD45
MAIGLPVYFYYQAKNKWHDFKNQFCSGIWLIAYLLCMITISYCGSNKFGGHNFIPYGWDLLLITALALFFYYWGVRSGRYTKYMKEAEKVNGVLLHEEGKNRYTSTSKVV